MITYVCLNQLNWIQYEFIATYNSYYTFNSLYTHIVLKYSFA